MLKFVTHRPLWINIAAAVLLALLIIILLVLSLQLCTHHGSSKTVPLVVGKTFSEAKAILDKQGLEIVIQDSVYVDSLPPSAVIKQIPEGDAVVKVNRTVYLTINQSQPPLVAVPLLKDYTYRNAAMTLASLGLVADTTYKTDFARDNVKEVLYQDQPIEPGTKVRMGSHIKLVLGSGVGLNAFLVPNLIGMTYGEAKAKLEANGINLIVLSAPGVSDSSSAFISSQEPRRFSSDGQVMRIRSGQLISVTLSPDRPNSGSNDTLNHN